ncbi:uncharacterized protein LOC115325022 [Ixodes scapularis]|uniref:uncharacterized protein LOC115325022 n=1 Tax=Ixodes scapularis TaxID=6945 RepID=UPI001C3834CC|nr:uncharacterized protein LOC115325022 [Ixodes scapularis]
MIALFFLGVLLLCHSHAINYPDANEVMTKLPQTFMIQSLGNYPNLICGYQHFYNETRRGQTYLKYDSQFKYPDRLIGLSLYVRNVTGYKIIMATRPESVFPATYSRHILFSNMKSCMIIKNPDPAFPQGW